MPLTFRITTASHERLRRMAFETRVSQQSLVDQALDQFFAEQADMVAWLHASMQPCNLLLKA